MARSDTVFLRNGSYYIEYPDNLTERRLARVSEIAKKYYGELDRAIDKVNSSLRFFSRGDVVNFEGVFRVDLDNYGNLRMVVENKLNYRENIILHRRSITSQRNDFLIKDASGYRHLIPAVYYLGKVFGAGNDDLSNLIAGLLALLTIEEGLGGNAEADVYFSIMKSGKLVSGYGLTFRIIKGGRLLLQKADISGEDRTFAEKYVKAIAFISSTLYDSSDLSKDAFYGLLSAYATEKRFLATMYARGIVSSDEVRYALKNYVFTDSAYELAKKGFSAVVNSPSSLNSLRWEGVRKLEKPKEDVPENVEKSIESAEAETRSKETKKRPTSISEKVRKELSGGGREDKKEVPSTEITSVLEDEFEKEVMKEEMKKVTAKKEDAGDVKSRRTSNSHPEKKARPSETETRRSVGGESHKKIIEEISREKNNWVIEDSGSTAETIDSRKRAKSILIEIINLLRKARDELPNDFRDEIEAVVKLCDEYQTLDFSNIKREQWREKYERIGGFLKDLSDALGKFLSENPNSPLKTDISSLPKGEIEKKLKEVETYISDFASAVKSVEVRGRIDEEVKLIQNSLDGIVRRMTSILSKMDEEAKRVISESSRRESVKKKLANLLEKEKLKIDEKLSDSIRDVVSAVEGSVTAGKKARIKRSNLIVASSSIRSLKRAIALAEKRGVDVAREKETVQTIEEVYNAVAGVVEQVRSSFSNVDRSVYTTLKLGVLTQDSIKGMEEIAKKLDDIIGGLKDVNIPDFLEKTGLARDEAVKSLSSLSGKIKGFVNGKGTGKKGRKSKTAVLVEEEVSKAIDLLSSLKVAVPIMNRVSNREAISSVEQASKKLSALRDKVSKSRLKTKGELLEKIDSIIGMLSDCKTIIEEINKLPPVTSLKDADLKTLESVTEKVNGLVRRVKRIGICKGVEESLRIYVSHIEDVEKQSAGDTTKGGATAGVLSSLEDTKRWLGNIRVGLPEKSCDKCPEIVSEASKRTTELKKFLYLRSLSYEKKVEIKEVIESLTAVVKVASLFERYPLSRVKGISGKTKKFESFLVRVKSAKSLENKLPENIREVLNEYLARVSEVSGYDVSKEETPKETVNIRSLFTKLESIKIEPPIRPGVRYERAIETIAEIRKELRAIDESSLPKTKVQSERKLEKLLDIIEGVIKFLDTHRYEKMMWLIEKGDIKDAEKFVADVIIEFNNAEAEAKEYGVNIPSRIRNAVRTYISYLQTNLYKAKARMKAEGKVKTVGVSEETIEYIKERSKTEHLFIGVGEGGKESSGEMKKEEKTGEVKNKESENGVQINEEKVRSEVVERLTSMVKKYELDFASVLHTVTPDHILNLRVENIAGISARLEAIKSKAMNVVDEIKRQGGNEEDFGDVISYMSEALTELKLIKEVLERLRENNLKSFASLNAIYSTLSTVYSGRKIDSEERASRSLSKVNSLISEVSAFEEALEEMSKNVKDRHLSQIVERAMKEVRELKAKSIELKESLADNIEIPNKEEVIAKVESEGESKRKSVVDSILNAIKSLFEVVLDTQTVEERPEEVPITAPVEKYPSEIRSLIRKANLYEDVVTLGEEGKKYVLTVRNMLRTYEEKHGKDESVEGLVRVAEGVELIKIPEMRENIEYSLREAIKRLEMIERFAKYFKPEEMFVLFSDKFFDSLEETVRNIRSTITEYEDTVAYVRRLYNQYGLKEDIVGVSRLEKVLDSTKTRLKNVEAVLSSIPSVYERLPRVDVFGNVSGFSFTPAKIVSASTSSISDVIKGLDEDIEREAREKSTSLFIEEIPELNNVDFNSDDVIKKLGLNNKITTAKAILTVISNRIKENNRYASKVVEEIRNKGSPSRGTVNSMRQNLRRLIEKVDEYDRLVDEISKLAERRAKEHYKKTKEKKLKELERSSNGSVSLVRKAFVRGEEIHYDSLLDELAYYSEVLRKVRKSAEDVLENLSTMG